MCTDGSTSDDEVFMICSKSKLHVHFIIFYEKKIDKESGWSSQEVGFDGMESIFVGKDESQDKNVMCNNDKEVWKVCWLCFHNKLQTQMYLLINPNWTFYHILFPNYIQRKPNSSSNSFCICLTVAILSK